MKNFKNYPSSFSRQLLWLLNLYHVLWIYPLFLLCYNFIMIVMIVISNPIKQWNECFLLKIEHWFIKDAIIYLAARFLQYKPILSLYFIGSQEKSISKYPLNLLNFRLYSSAENCIKFFREKHYKSNQSTRKMVHMYTWNNKIEIRWRRSEM